ncbi:MAG: hypothetical protein HY782_03045 [Chloroflexi bacterium]|nr:hypothetical protein [Chloroflexota bacterium]
MTHADPLSHARSSEWTARDVLLVVAALLVLAGMTAAVAWRDRWTTLVAANPAIPVSIATLTTTEFHSLAFDPRDPDIVYFGHHEGVLKSVDGGRTWKPILQQGDAMSLVALDNALVMAGHQILMRGDSAGSIWNFIGTNLPDHDIHGFAVSPANPNTFFAFVVSYGLWRSDDAGATWTLISKELPETVLALAVEPTTPETLYAGTMDKGLLKSGDGGKTWKPVNTLSMKMALGLAQDPRDPRIVFAGTEGGLYRSNADGSAWTRVGLAGKDIATVAVSRANPARILAIDAQGRVYRSDDGGATWGR